MNSQIRNLNALLAISYGSFMRFIKDRPRVISSLVFPAVTIGILGGGIGANIKGYDFITFVFVGTVANTLFQTTAQGLLNLVIDRESGLTQELYVAPVSRGIIFLGKILGEGAAAYIQVLGVIAIAIIMGANVTSTQLILSIVAGIPIALLGGAFGIVLIALANSQQAANALFPVLILPQFFLAGVFNPIKNLTGLLNILSHITPLRYAVDFQRGIFYRGLPEYDSVVLMSPWKNLIVIIGFFMLFLIGGGYMYLRRERNR